MSVKEFLKKAHAEFVDITPVVPAGVRILTHEKSAAELAQEARTNSAGSSSSPDRKSVG